MGASLLASEPSVPWNTLSVSPRNSDKAPVGRLPGGPPPAGEPGRPDKMVMAIDIFVEAVLFTKKNRATSFKRNYGKLNP